MSAAKQGASLRRSNGLVCEVALFVLATGSACNRGPSFSLLKPPGWGSGVLLTIGREKLDVIMPSGMLYA